MGFANTELSVRDGVLAALLRVALMTAMQYRASFLLELLSGAGTTIGVVLPLVFVYDHTQAVASWSFPESLLVASFFLILQALVGGLIEPNLGALVEAIRSGQFDYLLLKPPDAQLVASMSRVAPARIWDLLGGIGVGIWALQSLPTPSFGNFIASAVLLGTGLAAVYGIWILVICTSFWFVRVDNMRYLLTSVVDAGRWPVSVYSGWVRIFLTMVVPVALVTSYPAIALLGRLDGPLAAQGLGVALGMLLLSRMAWKLALKHYTSASS